MARISFKSSVSAVALGLAMGSANPSLAALGSENGTTSSLCSAGSDGGGSDSACAPAALTQANARSEGERKPTPGDTGGTAPAVLNGANEVAVAAFLDGRIGFMDIPALVAHALDTVPVEPADTLDGVMAADQKARTAVSAAMAVRV